MANLYVDGFEWLPTAIGSDISSTDMSKAGWFIQNVNGQLFGVQTGRFGYGKAIYVNKRQINGFSTRYIKTFPDLNQPAQGYTGMAIRRDAVSDPNGWHGFAFYDAVTGTPQVSVVFGRNGVVAVYPGFPPNNFTNVINGALAVSKAGVFDEDVWFYAEAYAVVANSGGSVEVRIDTVPVIQVVSADTQTTAHAYYDSIALIAGSDVSSAVNVVGYWDDLYANDSTGGTNNSWLGNVRAKSQFMIANGATNNFLIGGSAPAVTNWQSVLNQAVDDTKYVYSATLNDIDLYTPDPIINAPLVHVVQLRAALRQDDATQRQAKGAIRISGTVYPNTTNFFTTQNYSHYFSRWELNPATGVSFTGAEVNGFQVGTKLTV